MNSDINGITNIEYTLEDAFEIIKSSLGDSYQIINSIMLSQKKKYEDIINSMDKKIGILNIQIENLKKENSKFKNTTLQLQNKLLTLSDNLKQLSKDDNNDNIKNDIKYRNLKGNNLSKNKETVEQIKNDIAQELNDNDSINNQKFNKMNNNYYNNELFNLNKPTIDLDQIKTSINHQLFNKKLKKKERKFPKGFNSSNNDTTPTRIIQKENNLFIKENESQSSNSLENNYNKKLQSKSISNLNKRRKTFNNLALNNSISQIDGNPNDKFNMIAKRIKHLKNGLTINNIENNNDNNIRYYTTYSLSRKNYFNSRDINSFDN